MLGGCLGWRRPEKGIEEEKLAGFVGGKINIDMKREIRGKTKIITIEKIKSQAN